MKRGFTLLELIIVIIIIGILATLGLNQYMGLVEKSRSAEAKGIVGQLRSLCAGVYLEIANTSACQGANLTLGDGTGNTIPSTVCAGSHYFNYTVTAFGGAGTPAGSGIRIVGRRCTANGKSPNIAVTDPRWWNLSVDYGNGTVDSSSSVGY